MKLCIIIIKLCVSVWSCSWHWDGVALLSGSMDHTAKLWDTNQYDTLSSLTIAHSLLCPHVFQWCVYSEPPRPC
jgi:WD40 repeat protein